MEASQNIGRLFKFCNTSRYLTNAFKMQKSDTFSSKIYLIEWLRNRIFYNIGLC